MEVSQVLLILVVLGSVLVGAQKSYGRFYTKQESVQSTVKKNEICQLSLGLVRKSRSDRMEGFERVVEGYINLSRNVGPVGGTVTCEKMTQNGWKNDYAPIELKRICDMPYNRVLDPFFAHFSGELNKIDCSIKQGNYTVKNWTMEENLRLVAGDQLFYETYKFTITLRIPERKTPICGFSVVLKVEDLDLLQHTLKRKRNKQ